MNDKIYKITLSDGTTLENLKLSGNNFISDTDISTSVFDSNCSPVVINDGSVDEIHENMELVQVIQYEGKYWFILRDLTEREITTAKMKSDIEYLAMMSDIEL